MTLAIDTVARALAARAAASASAGVDRSRIVPVTGRAGVYTTRSTGVTSAQVRWDTRKAWVLRNNVVEIYAEWLGFYTNTTGVEIANGNNQTIAAALEYAGVTKRFTFGGANTGTIVSGSTILRSDPLYAADFGLAYFPEAAAPFVREERTVSPGQNVNRYGSVRSYAGEKTYLSDGLAASQLMGTGVMSQPAGGSTLECCASAWRLVGRVAGAPKDSFVILGDSLGAGEDDLYYGPSSHGDDGGGWFGRALYDAALPFATLAVSGSKVSQFVTSFSAKREMLRSYEHVVIMFGTNDGVAVGAATAWLDIQIAIAAARAGGAKTVTVLTLPPRTTGSWGSAGAQTPVAGWEVAGTFRDPLNTLIRGSVGTTGGPDFVFDFGKLCENPAAPAAWFDNGTDDGTHPSQTTVVNVLKPRFAALVPAMLAK